MLPFSADRLNYYQEQSESAGLRQGDLWPNVCSDCECSRRSAGRLFHSLDMSQIVENAISRNVKESFNKFLDPDLESDEFLQFFL